MSGPSLRQLQAHRSIHDGAFVEAKHLTELLEQLHSDGREEQILEVADALIEHWEMRIIAHAESEEEGFYKEKIAQDPSLLEKIVMFKRDHDLMRRLVADIKDVLSQKRVDKEMLDRFRALLLINHIHSREEEKFLF
ncbi:hypothetical protein [Bacillus alveayuensis]|jgi:hypothetical protein|uniref:hypothetical protein n=1 Tax=Aeribacillus alveayuensis TaxID=279215 RepID=UPI0005CCF65E|nr:hypothetical protein [Bacillus alveayuensis]